MSCAYTPDLSHRFCYVPNFAARSTGHGPGGRLRIQFDNPSFVAWRNAWGKSVSFTRLEYRKFKSGVKHEFVLLRRLSKRSDPNVSQNPSSGASLPPNLDPDTVQPSWLTTIPEEVAELVIKIEREASPDSQINALTGTEAFDYLELTEWMFLSKKERNSTLELIIDFPDEILIEEVIKISSGISRHQHAKLYTLQQFNCFFYCWTIITILLRLQVRWAPALESDTDGTMELLITRLVELSDPQRTRAENTPGTRPNLALIVAGEYDLADQTDTAQRPFIRLCRRKLNDLSTLRLILNALQDPARELPLWIHDDLSLVRDYVRDLLNEIADVTTGLAVEGTGEMTIDRLFWGDTRISGLSTEWEGVITEEVNALLEIYLNKMWENFNEALSQTKKANEEKQQANSITRNRRSNALQRIGNSPLILGARLTPMGLRAAWKAAHERASLGVPKSPFLPLLLMIEAMSNMPTQIHNVSTIARNFLAVLATKRDEVRHETHSAPANTQQGGANHTLSPSLDLRRSTVLGMMSDIDLRRPELENQVVCELEMAIKNMALKGPTSGMHDLRMATLEMLIRLKETGKRLRFGLQPHSIWRICLWYSMGEEIVKVLEAAAEPGPTIKIRCWLRTSKDEPHDRGEPQAMLVSEIHDFIRGRIKDLSEMLHNRGGPGASAYCRKEIEDAMNTIWKGLLSENAAEVQTSRVDRH